MPCPCPAAAVRARRQPQQQNTPCVELGAPDTSKAVVTTAARRRTLSAVAAAANSEVRRATPCPARQRPFMVSSVKKPKTPFPPPSPRSMQRCVSNASHPGTRASMRRDLRLPTARASSSKWHAAGDHRLSSGRGRARSPQTTLRSRSGLERLAASSRTSRARWCPSCHT